MIGLFKRILVKFLGMNVLKQEALLRMALNEKGISYKNCAIKIDHVNGKNFVNGVQLNVVYPMSFMEKAKDISIAEEKVTKYYFNGNMSESGKRSEMLSQFMNRNDAIIISSDFGRSQFNKFKFNHEYFRGLASSIFGLCPHQADWNGPRETIWTYRFIECCMTNTIPVIFRDTPLGDEFTDGFFFIYDDELDVEINNLHEKALANYSECVKRFTISEENINDILVTRKK